MCMDTRRDMNNNLITTVQTKAKEYIDTEQYDKVFTLNDILKDYEMNDKVFLEGELLKLR